jgi:6-phosphogluconolactonase
MDEPIDHESPETTPGDETEAAGAAATTGAGEGAGTEEGRAHWEPSPPQVHGYKNPEAVARAAAKRFLDSAKRAVEKNDRFTVVLAGGSTPRRLYSLLTEPPYRDAVPWKATFFVFGDERCVPPDDEASNYRMVRQTLFAPLGIPDHRVLRMKGERPPEKAAELYEIRLGDLFLGRSKRRFDLVLLGIGADGHTASLFPGTTALQADERWVAANHVPQLDAWRLTLTLKALSSARRVIFMATGAKKAAVIAEAFGGVEHAPPHPCELVAPMHARREVLLDHEAASMLPQDAPPGEPAKRP